MQSAACISLLLLLPLDRNLNLLLAILANYCLASSIKEDAKGDYVAPANDEVGRSDECRERPTATTTTTHDAVCEKELTTSSC